MGMPVVIDGTNWSGSGGADGNGATISTRTGFD